MKPLHVWTVRYTHGICDELRKSVDMKVGVPPTVGETAAYILAKKAATETLGLFEVEVESAFDDREIIFVEDE